MSDNPVKILVVEDDPKHRGDAVKYISNLKNCNVDFATTLAGAFLLIEINAYSGIISDVFFPDVEGGDAGSFANAIALNEKALELKTHIVFNTSGNHHGKKYRGFLHATAKAIHNDGRYHFLTSGMVIESYPEDSDADLDFKQWQAAFRYMFLVLEAVSQNYEIPIPSEDNSYLYQGFSYGEYGQLTSRFNKCNDPFALSAFAKYNA